GNIEQNLEFHTILPNNKIFLSLKHKENKSTQNIILNTIQGETIEYKSDKENYVKNLILECNFDRTTGILIDTNKKFLFYNGKKVDLITHYKDVSTYAVNDSIKKFKKGVSISNSTYITFEGEVLPIKSFIPNETLKLSIIKNKYKNLFMFNLNNLYNKFEKELKDLMIHRIERNIDGYKSKLNKEILKEFIK
ncbi:hypothetical protein, partial [Plesiomonas sp.]|uniref:hypothetical protein n=1 Tax=Plesiomonas sp. TaxID=2486279 RepID=UPI003F2FAECA